jgi:hypothetical protein
VAPYRIELHGEAGEVREVHADLFASDDDAIDHAGRIGNAYAMKVWQGSRLVAHFPAVGQPHRPL